MNKTLGLRLVVPKDAKMVSHLERSIDLPTVALTDENLDTTKALH